MKKYKINFNHKIYIVDANSRLEAVKKIKDYGVIPYKFTSELKRYANRYEYEWSDIEDGYNFRIKKENMSPNDAFEDLLETMSSRDKLI